MIFVHSKISVDHYLEPKNSMTLRASVTKYMEKHFEKNNDELKVKLASADRLMLALTRDHRMVFTNES